MTDSKRQSQALVAMQHHRSNIGDHTDDDDDVPPTSGSYQRSSSSSEHEHQHDDEDLAMVSSIVAAADAPISSSIASVVSPQRWMTQQAIMRQARIRDATLMVGIKSLDLSSSSKAGTPRFRKIEHLDRAINLTGNYQLHRSLSIVICTHV
jgi:hypothetical protein